MITALLVGWAAASVARRLGSGGPMWWGLLGGIGVMAPAVALAGAVLAAAVGRFRSAQLRSRHEAALEAAAVETGELVVLGLAGGLSVGAAHRVAADHAPEVIGPHLASLVRRMEETGTESALGRDQGPLADNSAVLVSAAATGAPVLPALQSHLDTEVHRHHMARLEATRRIPVRLLVPLTLFVLPGFVLIVVGPVVVTSLARLTG